MSTRRNGGIIGPQNRTTSVVAPGIWHLDDNQESVLARNWPGFTPLVPNPPAISAVSATTTTITVTFSLGYNGGSAITSSTVVAVAGGVSYTATGSSPLTITGLTQGTTYTIYAYSTNAVGDSINSYGPSTKTQYTVSYLLVAGGGGSTPASGTNPGAGGAGGLLSSTYNVTPSTVYNFTVGAGGGGGSNGSDSTGLGLTAIGGGGNAGLNGFNGGCGGGGANQYYGGVGSQGYNGGNGILPNMYPYSTGGGGGAGSAGSNGSTTGGGNGGIGTTTSLITTSQATSANVGQVVSSSVYFSGGGGGCTNGGSYGVGGYGGGGNGNLNSVTNPTNGASNTGGGSGSIAAGPGPNILGGSGCIIISIPTSYYSGTTTGSPTVVTNGSNTVLIFKGNGSYTA